MAQTKKEIQLLLEQADSEPRQRFGQNFMIDQNLVRLVAEAAQIESGDMIVEVGPGTGTLTEELVQTGAQVLAIEIDRNLANLLRSRFKEKPNFHLIEADALAGKHAIHPQIVEIIRASKSAGRRVKLCANLPYNIASPLLVELLIAGVDLLAFTVQIEVAERFAPPPARNTAPFRSSRNCSEKWSYCAPFRRRRFGRCPASNRRSFAW